MSISAQELDVGIPVEEYPELFFGRTMPTHGEGKIAVFLIQFPDYKNENPDATAAYYNQLYFSAEPLDGTKESNPWYGSVTTFYREQSMDKLNLSGQVFDWYTAKHERSHYDSTSGKKELVMEAVAYYEGKGVDFAQFDGDKNGEIDAVIYHFAGPADDIRTILGMTVWSMLPMRGKQAAVCRSTPLFSWTTRSIGPTEIPSACAESSVTS